MKKLLIIGAGAAGMMAAIKAPAGYQVTILEKNEKAGKKLFITGKGRCNVTNDSDSDNFMRHTVSNPKFLFTAISAYDQHALMDDLSKWGLKLKTERGDRVFPLSDHSSDVIRTLETQVKKRNGKIIYGENVSELLYENFQSDNPKDKYQWKANGVRTKSGKTYMADTIIFATGGLSYPQTGSTGDGHRILQKIGVSSTEMLPALCALETAGPDAPSMMGLAMKNVSGSLIVRKNPDWNIKKDKVIYQELGEMLFTHFGISGPIVLSASSYLANIMRKHGVRRVEKGFVTFSLDLKPALTEEKLDLRLQRDFEKYQNREFQNALSDLLPRMMIPVVVKRSGIEAEKKVNQITHEERKNLLSLLKNLEFDIVGMRDFPEAIITSGGIDVKEINPSTMELKKIKNVKCVGELIDCDALTGGYNLQIAWATSCLASSTLDD